MEDRPEPRLAQLPPPWDRIFSLGTRLFVWGLLAAILYLLRPFFLLIFLTFVFAYIQDHGVEGLEQRFRKRWVRAVLVFAVFLGTWVAVGIYLMPHVQKQVETIASKHDAWIEDADQALRTFAKEKGFDSRLPPNFSLRNVLEDLLGLFSDDSDGEAVAAGADEGAETALPAGDGETAAETRIPAVDGKTAATRLRGGSGKTAETRIAAGNPNTSGGRRQLAKTIEFMKGAAGWILAVGSAFLLSLLFSFLIVLDMPRLARGVRGLANTKVGFIYAEVADSIYSFCKVLGRAMEAQAIIAICNTILTALGLWLIGVGEGNMVFLCTVVFLCSFIPVAGVFFSSTPICIAALSEGGVGLMLAAVAMILIIHAIEAYILNPRIYGHHLRMNPVLTLIILVLCGKLFGPWGLILGIPVFNYVFTHAIRFKKPQNPAAGSQAA